MNQKAPNQTSLERSSSKINDELSKLQQRTALRKSQSRRSAEKEVKQPKSYPSTILPVTIPVSHEPVHRPVVKTSSFGANMAPVVRNSETQTEKEKERQQRKISRKFHSMADIRPKNLEVYESIDTYSDTVTDAETVIGRKN